MAYGLIGNYLAFNTSIMHIGDLYKLKSNKTVFKNKYCKIHKHFIDITEYKAQAEGENNEENHPKDGNHDNREAKEGGNNED